MSSGGWFGNEQSALQNMWQKCVVKGIEKMGGAIPRHVAFVMDGNRRYARAKKMSHVVQGHEHGFAQLARVLNWCHVFGIHEVSIYAFSIENFKREKSEVDGLMKLAEEKFRRLLEEHEKLHRAEIRFSFSGNRRLLSPTLQKLMEDIEELTKENKLRRVNICMPYTSTDEMARGFEKIRLGVKSGEVKEDDINEELVEQMMDGMSNPVDLLVRTSGEKRLSDFYLWQTSNSHVYFSDALWPEFSFHHLALAIVYYQYHRSSIQSLPN